MYYVNGILFTKKDTISLSSGILSLNLLIIGKSSPPFILNPVETLLLLFNILFILFTYLLIIKFLLDIIIYFC